MSLSDPGSDDDDDDDSSSDSLHLTRLRQGWELEEDEEQGLFASNLFMAAACFPTKLN